MTVPPELIQRYKEGRLIPFVGAGVSMSVTWDGGKKRGPSWKELVDQTARLLGFENPDLLRARGTDLQVLEYFKLKRHEIADLTHWLAKEMQPPDEALMLSPIHATLAGLTKCRIFYTTNYDDLLERGLKLHGRTPTKIAIEAHMGKYLPSDPRACEVVKFHGDLSYPTAMVLSDSDYERRLRLDTVMDFRFRADLLGRAVLFMGYSFRDWNVSYLFRLVNDQLSGLPESLTKRRAYITVPDPSDFELRLFDDRNIGVISIPGSAQTEAVAELLMEISK
ncbi:MAG: SIR2 family protein [Bryobacteraceae bacterium]|nr:SIR2 family protein [Bryobacteraceae bacterium]